MHHYIISQLFSIGFKSGDCEELSVAALPLSSMNCLHTLAPWVQALSWTRGYCWLAYRSLCNPPQMCPIRLSVTHCQASRAGCTGPTERTRALMGHSLTQLLTVLSEICTWVAHLGSLYRALEMLVLLLGWCPSMALSSSPHVIVQLLIPPPHFSQQTFL